MKKPETEKTKDENFFAQVYKIPKLSLNTKTKFDFFDFKTLQLVKSTYLYLS